MVCVSPTKSFLSQRHIYSILAQVKHPVLNPSSAGRYEIRVPYMRTRASGIPSIARTARNTRNIRDAEPSARAAS
jgi:hypothetical protein